MQPNKYWKLTVYLKNSGMDELTLSFDQIEEILGFKLPKSARDYPVNWSNTETLTIPFAWLNAGYRTHDTNMSEGIVHFAKAGVTPTFVDTTTKRKEKNKERLNSNLTQKEEIILHLKENGTMTHRELSIKMYGDGRHLSNINESLQSLVREGVVTRVGERPAYYSLSGQEISIHVKTPRVKHSRFKTNKRREDIPNPSVDEVKYWLDAWNKLEDYVSQEKAVNRVFKDYSSNKSLENILIKCSVLNDFYSTNIFKIYPVAKHILSLDIDKRLKDKDPTLVNDIAKTGIAGNIKNFYSFASKYCSHHNQYEFPIYDSYVYKVLMYYKRVSNFSNFEAHDLKNYSKFKSILIEFRKFYELDQFDLKQLDRYLWQFGKRYFPKRYYKSKNK